MTNIILASGSPRRKEILEHAGINFSIQKSNFDEKIDDLEFSKEKIEEIAYQKGKEVAKRFPNDIIISADTVVVLDNKIFIKPKDKNDAFGMLKTLSGKTHFVLTSVCIIYKEKTLINSVITFVTFNDLSDGMINHYIETCKPFDKAGAYGIQELPEGFVNNIDGDIENVIGISSKVVKAMLQNVNT